MSVSIKLSLLSQQTLDGIEKACDYWAGKLRQTKPLNPVNENFSWAIPTEALLYLEQTSPRVELDTVGDYSIYAMFSESDIDDISQGNSNNVKYMAMMNGRLCVWYDKSISWIQLESLIPSEHSSPNSRMGSLLDIRNRLSVLAQGPRIGDSYRYVLLNISDITSALDERQVRRNGFSDCYADIFTAVDKWDGYVSEIPVPLIGKNLEEVGESTLTATIMQATQDDTTLISIDLPAGVGIFFNENSGDFCYQILEKHPVTGAIRSKVSAEWVDHVGALQFNWRCPVTVNIFY